MSVDYERSPLAREELLKMISVLSHDLKSPIFSIDGFSELLQMEYGDRLDDEGRDFLERIRGSVGQMKKTLTEMVEAIKLLSRSPAHANVAVSELLDEVRLRYNYLIDETGVELEMDGGPLEVSGDREMLREALAALVSNALSFTERPPGERKVSIRISAEGGSGRICVEDNGIGIAAPYHEQIFDLGIQIDKTRSLGAGYGLYVARKVAEAHGGRIDVESTEGEGSRFCLVLPLSA